MVERESLSRPHVAEGIVTTTEEERKSRCVLICNMIEGEKKYYTTTNQLPEKGSCLLTTLPLAIDSVRQAKHPSINRKQHIIAVDDNVSARRKLSFDTQ